LAQRRGLEVYEIVEELRDTTGGVDLREVARQLQRWGECCGVIAQRP
jgi:hypothetical protein